MLALDDCTTAALEFDNAEAIFSELGAEPDLEHVAPCRRVDPAIVPTSSMAGRTVLSNRERGGPRPAGRGRANREIAANLLISKHTVARHLENIYAKLGVRTRAAATAYAYEHDLSEP